jgi:hypothetical protein
LADRCDLCRGYKEGYSKVVGDKAVNVYIETVLITRDTSGVPYIIGGKETI